MLLGAKRWRVVGATTLPQPRQKHRLPPWNRLGSLGWERWIKQFKDGWGSQGGQDGLKGLLMWFVPVEQHQAALLFRRASAFQKVSEWGDQICIFGVKPAVIVDLSQPSLKVMQDGPVGE